MEYKKILFIGLGGAGQRHLRVFYDLLPSTTEFYAFRSKKTTPLLNSDFSVNENKTIQEKYNLTIFDSIEEAFSIYPDLTIISTPTSLHLDPMLNALKINSAIFVEKPWSNDIANFKKFSNSVLLNKTPFHISFQKRFNPKFHEIFLLIKNGQIGKILTATFNVFSNVRVWHPYENWKDLYAVNSKLGGGVLLTEIHEIDLAYWFFGLPKEVFCNGGNMSEEVLDIEDTVNIILIYENFSIHINLCFMHKKQSRNFNIAGSRGDVSWSDSKDELKIEFFNNETESKNDDLVVLNDDMFYNQARKFLGDWDENDTIKSLNAASSSLAIVEAAKKSMNSGKKEKVSNELLINENQ